MYFAHVGDSCIYFLPSAGGMKQITNDDTYVGWLFRNGQINEREPKNHPQRNVLQKVLGADPQQMNPRPAPWDSNRATAFWSAGMA